MNSPEPASPVSPRTTVRRLRERGRYERSTITEILDEGLICHVGFIDSEHPFVIPTIHARLDDTLYLHGSPGSRTLGLLKKGARACVTVTIVDALVLARSAFHHSMNYRSAVVLGELREVTDRDEKMLASKALTDHVVPGRWDEIRRPNDDELRKTTILAMSLDEASAKVRTGPPVDDEEDYELPIWAGLLPVPVTPGAPEPDPRLPASSPVPDHVTSWDRQNVHPDD
jgi:nitroimidazol reductase NimA-like FMN-containing flavoprotein (pyridoxamine 5'-phosphate oxidase superfamily)